MLDKTLSAIVLAAVVVLGGSAAARAATEPTVTAEPSAIAAGEQSTVTASGLGGLETAYFGLGGGGSLIDPDTGQPTNTVEAPVSNGIATATFTASEAGDYVVAVGDGETSLAQVSITVTGATASPEPTPTVTVTATSEPSPQPTVTAISGDLAGDGLPAWAIVLIVVLAVLVVAGIVTIVVLVARRGRTGGRDT